MDDWLAVALVIAFCVGFLWHYLQVYLDSLVRPKKEVKPP